MTRALLIISALALVLIGCGPQDASEFLEGPDADFGKSLFSDLQAKNLKAIEGETAPEVLASAAPLVLEQMAAQFPSTPPRSVLIAGLNVIKFSGLKDTARRVDISLQYEFDSKWLLASARWRETASGDKVIEAINVQVLPASLMVINAFELSGKSIGHYVVLALAIALPLFSIAVLILCVSTPLSWKRKIWWCVGILLGLGKINFSWTNGAIFVQPLFFQFLSAGWIRSGVGPIIISISIPLFAILFLWKWRAGKFAVLDANGQPDAVEAQPSSPEKE